MEIIIKNWDTLSLTNIPDWEINLVRKNNQEVITNIPLSEEDKKKIYQWCVLNSDYTITETEEYIENSKCDCIAQFNELVTESTNIRAMCLTAPLMPEWTLKDLKIAKLAAKEAEIIEKYNLIVKTLIAQYGEGILEELSEV